jgi:outer membrane protein TolC
MMALVMASVVGLGTAVPGPPATVANEPARVESLSVEEVVEAALQASPDLLDVVDALASAQANLVGVRSTFLPQVTPFFNRLVRDDTNGANSLFGISVSQQFSFGPLLKGSVQVLSPSSSGTGYGSAYFFEVNQQLLRGADPVVPAEPLWQATLFRNTQARAAAAFRRQTVLTAWTAYLNVALGNSLVDTSRDQVARADRIVAASEAKYAAGTVSRLDVLRSQQLSASARLQLNDSLNFLADAQDALTRLTGRPPGTTFRVVLPGSLPVTVPDGDTAIDYARAHREPILEQRERLRDAEISLRIARSNILPSLSAFAGWTGTGTSSTLGGSLSAIGPSTFNLGFRSDVPLNLGLSLAQKREADIALGAVRRNLSVVEQDVVREVRQSLRRLRLAHERLPIEEANLEVAAAQFEVANMRYEKGLSSNFDLVDAETLYNNARISVLTSRNELLLAELGLLVTSALLDPADFVVSGRKERAP